MAAGTSIGRLAPSRPRHSRARASLPSALCHAYLVLIAEMPSLSAIHTRSTKDLARIFRLIWTFTVRRTRCRRPEPRVPPALPLLAHSGPCARGYFCRPAAEAVWGISDPGYCLVQERNRGVVHSSGIPALRRPSRNRSAKARYFGLLDIDNCCVLY